MSFWFFKMDFNGFSGLWTSTVSAKDLVLSVVSRILVRFSLDLDFGSWFS